VATGFALSCLTIALTSVLLLSDGSIARGGIAALSAAALATTAFRWSQAETDLPNSAVTRLTVVALVPAIWMLAQVMPFGLVGLGHPVWESVSGALGRTISATISLDPGATVIAIGRYTGFVALGLAVALSTLDRQNAERMLFVLLATSTMAAVLLLSGFVGTPALTSAITICAVGCIVAAAAAIRAYERSETRRKGSESTVLANAATGLGIAGISFVLCLTAIMRFAPAYLIAATAIGLGIFAALALTRRLGFGMWGFSALAITLIIIAAAALPGISQLGNPLMALVDYSNRGDVETATRMIADGRWSGSGGGTFSEVAQLYRDFDARAGGVSGGPTTAAILRVELGWPVTIFAAISTIVSIIFLLTAAVRRGRDSFYPATGTASLCILLTTSLADRALLDTSVALTITAIIGVAVAQSAGRRAH
jgi:hypothetical protein